MSGPRYHFCDTGPFMFAPNVVLDWRNDAALRRRIVLIPFPAGAKCKIPPLPPPEDDDDFGKISKN